MAKGEVWNEVLTLFKVATIKVVEIRLFVAQDDTRALPDAFRMLASLRILGAQIDNDSSTNNFTVKNGNVTVPITVDTFKGNVQAEISDWHGTDGDGNSSSDSGWTKAEKVAYKLTGIGKVTIPVAAILGLVPGIGAVLKAILNALPGKQVTFSLGQVDVEIPIHRQNGKVVLPSGAVVPPWWP
jgi:hypothetical protein